MVVLKADQRMLTFIACTNHDTNVGWNKLYFVAKDRIRCSECGTEFSLDEIKVLMRDEFLLRKQYLQESYTRNMALLDLMNNVEAGEKEGRSDACKDTLE